MEKIKGLGCVWTPGTLKLSGFWLKGMMSSRFWLQPSTPHAALQWLCRGSREPQRKSDSDLHPSTGVAPWHGILHGNGYFLVTAVLKLSYFQHLLWSRSPVGSIQQWNQIEDHHLDWKYCSLKRTSDVESSWMMSDSFSPNPWPQFLTLHARAMSSMMFDDVLSVLGLGLLKMTGLGALSFTFEKRLQTAAAKLQKQRSDHPWEV